MSLAVSVWFGYQSLVLARRAQGLADTDVAELANRLARLVMSAETDARDELLGRDTSAIDIALDFRPAPGTRPGNPLARTDLTDIVSYFNNLHPQRLMIIGAGGAGKTVLAIELIVGLLETRSADGAVPVRLSASEWDPHHDTVEALLIMQLEQTYGMLRSSAAALVEARKIVPVIDGLDEMDSDGAGAYTSRAARAIAELNTYQHGRHRSSVVVTCRTDQHAALDAARVWMRNAATLEVQPVTAARAVQFIRARVIDPARWEPIIAAIAAAPSGPIALGLSTPWRLTLAVTVYDQRNDRDGSYVHDLTELARIAARGIDTLREYLVSQMIPAVCGDPAARHPYPPDHVHRWLGVLSHDYLSGTSRFDSRFPTTTDLLDSRLPLIIGRRRLMAVGGAMIIGMLSAIAICVALLTPTETVMHKLHFLGLVTTAAVSVATGNAIWMSYIYRTRDRRWYPFDYLANSVVGTAAVSALLTQYGNGRAGLPWSTAIGAAFILMFVLPFLADYAQLHLMLMSRRQPWSGVHAGVRGLGVRGCLLVMTWAFVFVVVSPWQYAFVVSVVLTAFLLSQGLSYSYFVMLLCTRHAWSARPLPWRLGRFLDWCHEVRLLRIAGSAYQFRHRELQDYLERHPTP
ncbi:NACHT domain-containing protein [Nocardia sp. NPDC050710]|uniref:NACHT domain-containing protein n=1 Tax=Nocardia sp. NPDC050710 TaxID=3157220 RepID=UPI0033FC2E0A